MSLSNYVFSITLLAGVTGCLVDPEDDLTVETAEGELKCSPTSKWNPPGCPTTTPTTPAPAPVTTGGEAFIDACLLPGMTKATFRSVGGFDAYDEGVTAALDLPFAFTFHGASHTKFWVTTNGQLGFGTTVGGTPFGQVSCPLPAAQLTAPTLLVYSADLVGRYDAHAGVCIATTGTAPNRKLVVTWKDSFFYEAWLTSNVTFSATLNEGTNVVDVGLKQVDSPQMPGYEAGWAAALGRQAGGSGYGYSCYQDRALEGLALHYQP